MNKVYICKNCHNKFNLKQTEKKASNGAYILYYDNGFRSSNKSHCHPCKKLLIRQKRGDEEREKARKYEKTKKGFLMRVYRNMKSRILGIQKRKHHLYKGKELLSKEDFYSWAFESDDFHRLFELWENSNHERKLSPSVDRIDSSKGYKISNMEWVTHSENSRRGSLSKQLQNS
jgi:hypothetical protein